MNSKLLIFTFGIACGAAGAYFYLKDKFQQYADEEIRSVKEAYKNDKKVEETNDISQKPDLDTLLRKVREEGYKDYSTKVEKEPDPVHEPFNEDPYIISYDDYGKMDNYEEEALMLYADGVLAYEKDDELIDDVGDIIGDIDLDNVLNETIYIRNDVTKTDYEIIKDPEHTYEQMTGNKPHRVEVE